MKVLDFEDIRIVDDIISPTYQNLILNRFTNPEENYQFVDEISHVRNNVSKNFGFAKPLSNRSTIFDSLYFLFEPVIYEMGAKLDIDFELVMQTRAFMITPGTPDVIDKAHVDFTLYHIAMLYYVNDSDGDTIFFNEAYQENDQDFYDPEQFTIYKRVTPKKGRIVVFNGLRYHSSTHPSSNYRLIINTNLL